MNNTDEQVMLFKMSNDLIQADIRDIEKKHNVLIFQDDNEGNAEDNEYFPQFEESIKTEGEIMSKYYLIFYCLEKSARTLVKNVLYSVHGGNWWDKCVPETIKKNAETNIQREIDSGFSVRSNDNIDYTTFGELGEIVKNNWDDFSDIFSSQRAFTKVMTNLNLLRGPIAHCCLLAEDEIVRLRLTVKDWFRLME